MAAARCCARSRRCRSICRKGWRSGRSASSRWKTLPTRWRSSPTRWKGEPHQAVYDLMHPEPHTMETVLSAAAALARRYLAVAAADAGIHARSRRQGGRPVGMARLVAADALDRDRRIAPRRDRRSGAAGWPIPGLRRARSTALLRERPATVENRWFARLYLLKALIIVVLAVFWLRVGADRDHGRLQGRARHDDALRLSGRPVACLRHRIEPDRYLRRTADRVSPDAAGSDWWPALWWRAAT